MWRSREKMHPRAARVVGLRAHIRRHSRGRSCELQAMYREGVRTYAVRTEHIEEDVQVLMDWLCAPPLPAVPAEKTGMPTWGLNPGLAEHRLIG